MFDMSLTYILVALLAVILNNVLVERLSLHTRITVGTSACRKKTLFLHLQVVFSHYLYKHLHLLFFHCFYTFVH